jgi:hypothetical protein
MVGPHSEKILVAAMQALGSCVLDDATVDRLAEGLQGEPLISISVDLPGGKVSAYGILDRALPNPWCLLLISGRPLGGASFQITRWGIAFGTAGELAIALLAIQSLTYRFKEVSRDL